jgi:hypothetical protein
MSEHPDWESVADDRFLQWVGTQPVYRQEMFYKTETGISRPAPDAHADGANPPASTNGSEPSKLDRDSQRRLEDNVAVKSSGRGGPSGPPDDYDKAFDYFAAQGS